MPVPLIWWAGPLLKKPLVGNNKGDITEETEAPLAEWEPAWTPFPGLRIALYAA
jgi:hypothetical protein